MQDQSAPSQDGATPFTLREAAEVLGISLNTLRRRIAAGQIQAERVQRPQGHVWQVYLHRAATQEHRANGTVQRDGDGTVQQPPQAMMQAEAMAAYTRSLLEPLVQTIERQAERVAELERENGRLTERLALAAPQQPVEASTAPESVEPAPEPPSRWWRAPDAWITPLVTLAVLALVAAVLVLAALAWRW